MRKREEDRKSWECGSQGEGTLAEGESVRECKDILTMITARAGPWEVAEEASHSEGTRRDMAESGCEEDKVLSGLRETWLRFFFVKASGLGKKNWGGSRGVHPSAALVQLLSQFRVCTGDPRAPNSSHR